MIARRTRPRTRLASGIATGLSAAILAGLALLAPGCATGDGLGTPVTHAAPYRQTVRWAVAPLLNESATSVVDPRRLADAIQIEIQSIGGIDAVPVNRTIVAMREENLSRITNAFEAQKLMRALDVDGLVVGTITSFNPYPPMTLGLALELHVRESASSRSADPLRLLAGPSDTATSFGSMGPVGPVAVVAEVFDASDQRVLKWVRDYAEARHVPDQAYQDDIYLVSMDRYARFAAYRLLGTIIGRERLRLAGV